MPPLRFGLDLDYLFLVASCGVSRLLLGLRCCISCNGPSVWWEPLEPWLRGPRWGWSIDQIASLRIQQEEIGKQLEEARRERLELKAEEERLSRECEKGVVLGGGLDAASDVDLLGLFPSLGTIPEQIRDSELGKVTFQALRGAISAVQALAAGPPGPPQVVPPPPGAPGATGQLALQQGAGGPHSSWDEEEAPAGNRAEDRKEEESDENEEFDMEVDSVKMVDAIKKVFGDQVQNLAEEQIAALTSELGSATKAKRQRRENRSTPYGG